MRHREIVSTLQGASPAGRLFGESDVDSISLPKGWKFSDANVESPADEMQRLIRKIGGKRQGGDKDPLLMARAARRLGITARRARTYWYAQPCIISSADMDRARELAFVAPIEEAISAVTAAEQYLANLREHLLDRVTGGIGPRGRDPADDGGRVPAHPAVRLSRTRHLAAPGGHQGSASSARLVSARRLPAE